VSGTVNKVGSRMQRKRVAPNSLGTTLSASSTKSKEAETVVARRSYYLFTTDCSVFFRLESGDLLMSGRVFDTWIDELSTMKINFRPLNIVNCNDVYHMATMQSFDNRLYVGGEKYTTFSKSLE
jgi:hypothetical protein